MSELKAFDIVVSEEGYGEGIVKYRRAVYDKSEADKVIAEKDCKIEKLKESLDELLKAKTEQIIYEVIQKTLIYGEGFVPAEYAIKLVAEIRHQKYKRCLAMARWCMAESNDCCLSDRRYWKRWSKRWKSYADKLRGLSWEF